MDKLRFPDDFECIAHPVVPGATQWMAKKEDKTIISIVGGGFGLYGNGVDTFEMYDFREEEPQRYLTPEEINWYLEEHPL